MKRRITELLKNIAIVLLLCNILALVLLALPGNLTEEGGLPFFSPISRLPLDTSAGAADEEAAEAFLPPVISVKHSGGRATYRRNTADLQFAYDRFSDLMAEAITTAQTGAAYADVSRLAGKNGVLFLCGGSVPVEVLTHKSIPAASAVEGAAEAYLLAGEDGVTALYAVTKDACIRYATAVDAALVKMALEEFMANGDLLAGQQGKNGVHPLSPWEQEVRLPSYRVSNPLSDDYAPKLAVALDFNPYGSGTYTEADGSTVYTEGTRSLTISPEGKVTFSAADESYTRFTVEQPTPAAYLELAGSLLSLVTEDAGTIGDLRLCGIRQEGETVTVSFCYYLSGIPVYPAAAEAVFQGAALQEMTCLLRQFRRESGVLAAMPAAQAAAIATRGALLLPAYHLSASGTLSAGWKEVF